MSAQFSSPDATGMSELTRAYNRRISKRLLLILLAFISLVVIIVFDVIVGPSDLTFGRTHEVILNRSDASPKEEMIIWK